MKNLKLFILAMALPLFLNADDAPAGQPADTPEKQPVVGAGMFNRGMLDVDQPMTITSDRFEFDYKQKVAIFDANVKLAHPQFYLEADVVFVFLDGEGDKLNELKNILAQGGVVMTNDDRRAECDWALYSRAEGTLVMRPVERPLARIAQGSNWQTGTNITFWVEDGRMTVEGSTVQIAGDTLRPGRDKKPAKEPEEEPAQEKPRGPSLYKDPEAKAE